MWLMIAGSVSACGRSTHGGGDTSGATGEAGGAPANVGGAAGKNGGRSDAGGAAGAAASDAGKSGEAGAGRADDENAGTGGAETVSAAARELCRGFDDSGCRGLHPCPRSPDVMCDAGTCVFVQRFRYTPSEG
jgi:hypothetical protein